MSRPIGVDLFAGAGGLSLGFESAGFDVVAAVEYDPIHCATHEFNFPHCAALCASVSDVTGNDIRSRSRIGKAEIDVVFGGAPCQGFSLIGKRSLDDPRNRLVYDFVRLVSELHPKYFVFENVKGLTVGDHKRFLYEIIAEFQKRGYKVIEKYQVLNAAEFGVPQDRRRLFLLGSRGDWPLPAYPAPTHRVGDASLLIDLPKSPTVWHAISDLPCVEHFPELLQQDWVFAKFGTATKYSKLLRAKKNAKGEELLSSSLRTIHTALSMKRFSRTPHGEIEPVSRFMKLDPSGLCNTLRAGTASDRGAFTSPRPIHPYLPRCITVREAARLHSYPDWFRFHATKWHGFRQVGNSVPPFLGRAVAAEIMRALRLPILNWTLETRRNAERDDLLNMNMSEAASYYQVSANVIPRRRRQVEAAYA